ncbi:hypothetical protein F4680DRAFT_469520 [Xylaria scruposa]|nr:hypothetical protein F4680DRAFT_469520 [Xylaria scruposa]
MDPTDQLPQNPVGVPNQPRRPLRTIEVVFGREVSIGAPDVPLLGPLFRRPRKQKIANLSSTMSGPPSPKPSPIAFSLNNMAKYSLNQRANLPSGHPYRITLGKSHPNESGTPALQSVRSLGHHATSKEGGCFEMNTDWAIKDCRKKTTGICVDLNHCQVTYICKECHDKSRAVIGRAVISIAKSLRAYACNTCSATLYSEDRFRKCASNVWGLPSSALAEGALGNGTSVNRGPLQPMTGCMCGTKLMDHTLCTPHRAHHFLEMRRKADQMRAFVMATFGQMVCPFCYANPGADATNFLDLQGNPCPNIVYMCMACLGFVVSDPTTHPTIDAPSWENAGLLLQLDG